MGATSVIGSIVNRERKSSWRNKFIKGEQSPSAPMEGVIICYFIYFLYLTSIKKKSSCVRNLFILILTIFNYSIVVSAFGELSPIYFKDLKRETPTSNILEEIYQ